MSAPYVSLPVHENKRTVAPVPMSNLKVGLLLGSNFV